jgi:hypothetical protein
LGLDDEGKSRAFCALLKELIALHGGGKGPIPVTSPDGENLGYHVAPPAAQAYFDAFGPKLSAEDVTELEERVKHGRRLSPTEARAELIAEVERQQILEPERFAS